MAIGNHLPAIGVSSASSSSTSSSSSILDRQYRTQVATDNSSTFIHFLTNSRQSSIFIPTKSLPTRPVSHTTDIQSITNARLLNSKDLNQKLQLSQQKCNPILNNALLNHRREKPKSLPIKPIFNSSQTNRLCLSIISCSSRRTRMFPFLQKKNSDQSTSSFSNVDSCVLEKTKYDYIFQWLHNVQQSTSNFPES